MYLYGSGRGFWANILIWHLFNAAWIGISRPFPTKRLGFKCFAVQHITLASGSLAIWRTLRCSIQPRCCGGHPACGFFPQCQVLLPVPLRSSSRSHRKLGQSQEWHSPFLFDNLISELLFQFFLFPTPTFVCIFWASATEENHLQKYNSGKKRKKKKKKLVL